MAFEVSRTTPQGNREGFTSPDAKSAVDEIIKRGWWDAPGLKIKDDGKVSITPEQLNFLAALQSNDSLKVQGVQSIG